MNTLTITIAPMGQGVIEVRVVGEVDLTTAGQVSDAVRTAVTTRPREVHLDMASVPFLDSSGIRTLLDARHEAAEQCIMLRVINPHRRVVRVLDITGVLRLLQDGAPPP